MNTPKPPLTKEESPSRYLAFDPTPIGLIAGRSLSDSFTYEWKKIRNRRFEGGKFICEICHASRPSANFIDGHEVYSFPNVETIKLEKVIYVCKICHHAIHMERTRWQYRNSPDYISEVERHYINVNGGISAADLDDDFRKAKQEGNRIRKFYGQHKTVMDYGDYQDAVNICLSRKRKKAATQDDDEDDGDFEMYPDHEHPFDIGHAD